MREILNAFIEHGITPPDDLVLNGRIHRFKSDKDDERKSGWYVGFENHTINSGESFEVVCFGSYRTGEKHIYQNDRVTTTAADKAHIKKQIVEARKKEEELREALWEETSYEVERKWNELFIEGLVSSYLERKAVAGDFDTAIRHDGYGSIFIPLRDKNNKLWSYQRIYPDGKKQFFTGGKINGNYHVLNEATLDRSDVVRITEGVATGRSLSLAVDHKEPIIIAFNANNLIHVAKTLKEMYPEKTFIICCDDDRWKKDDEGIPRPNVGRIKGEEAATAVLGRFVVPHFKSTETEPTDFNDLHLLEGIEEVKKQISIPVPKSALYALGYKEKEYFFTSTSNKQIVSVCSFSSVDFLNLMPMEYWEAVFPGGNGKPDWDTARSNLMQTCREKGVFQGRNVRGAGVWIDDNRIVVNMGDHLMVDGERIELGQIKSKYFYTLGLNLTPLNKPLERDECQHLIRACVNFKWIKEDAGILLAGALVLQRVCGALNVRPHIWVTGNAQTGKSTLLQKLIQKMIGRTGLYVQGNSTEAGVRQEIKADAVPVLFDEFETSGNKSDERIISLLELMRVAWSDSTAKIVKGTSSGNATHFTPRFCAVVSSIRTKLLDVADIRRFTVLELAPHGSDKEHWDRLKGYLNQITEEYSDRLFARSVKMLPTLLENFKVIQSVLSQRANSGFGDQYGMLLAGFSILVTDEPMTHEEAVFLADQMSFEEEKELLAKTDHDDCLEHLLTSTVIDGGSRHSIHDLIDSCLDKYHTDPRYNERRLRMYGLSIQEDYLFVANTGHAELTRIFAGTKWPQWPTSLKRLEGAKTSSKSVSFKESDGFKDRKGTFIPLSLIKKFR